MSEDADYIVKRLSYPASECTCEGQSRWLPLLLALIAVNIGYTFLAVNVSLWGHLGGLIAGALLTWPIIKARSRRDQWIIALAGLVVVIVVLFLGIPYP